MIFCLFQIMARNFGENLSVLQHQKSLEKKCSHNSSWKSSENPESFQREIILIHEAFFWFGPNLYILYLHVLSFFATIGAIVSTKLIRMYYNIKNKSHIIEKNIIDVFENCQRYFLHNSFAINL